MDVRFAAAWTVLGAMCGTAYAEPAPKDQHGAWSITAENDSLATGDDRNYTSGVKLSYVAPLVNFPEWASAARTLLEQNTGASPSLYGVALGHSIFTPEDITANPAPSDQHPYAGYLYLQLMAAAEEKRMDGRAPAFMDVVELELGLVGPGALGRQSQQGLHEWLQAPKPAGWDSQLKDEAVFALSLERRWRAVHDSAAFEIPGGLEADISPALGITIGTLRTEARMGLSMRVGFGLEADYGAPRVRPGLSGAGYFRPESPFSGYVFAGVDVRAVGRNLLLDGNTFRDSASVEKHPMVADAQLGVALQAGDWRLVYTYVTRSPEFKTQRERQDFGAVAISWRY